jgi:serine/threonine protein kinase
MAMTAREQSDLRSLVGATIDRRYVLRRQVGEGNFGAVFASDQHLLGLPVRRVAIKISKQAGIELDTARELFADAFLLAQAMDTLLDGEARRHLVHVYDLGITVEHESRCYVVMEYIDGVTLSDQLRSYGRVPAPLLLKWICQACTALRGLHRLEQAVLHRDVKPDNMLLGRDLTVRLVDFGLAARMLACGYAPGTAGTTAYMAPETADGRSVPASDVYSLGLVLYQGLTGELPFARVLPPATLPAQLHDEWLMAHRRRLRIAPPSERSSTATVQLDELVLSCLEFEARDRPQDAGELLHALDELGRRPPVERIDALERARALRTAGDAEGARQLLEDALGRSRLAVERRFWLLRELGGALAELGEHEAATVRLAGAWALTDDRAILRTSDARAALLTEISEGFARTGNAYQANRYARWAAAESHAVRGG